MDEPTNGLDPSQTQHMRALIRQVAEHATVILSTHIMQEVKAVCDRALILRSGQLVVDERLDSLVQTRTLRIRASGDGVESALGTTGVEALDVVDGAWQLGIAGDVNRKVPAKSRASWWASNACRKSPPVQQDLEAVFRRVSEEVPA
ncbi:MAG: hypothetical protein R3E84_07665 [Pseudomonadales bacterium]